MTTTGSTNRAGARVQWAAFVAAWAGWVLDAFDFTIYLLAMGQIAGEFHVGIATVSGSITLTLLVRLAGGAVAGWMADRWGRKLPLMLSLLWFAAFDAAIYFAPSFTAVLVLRTLFGFGMGAEWTAGTALAMESFPPRRRKIASGLLQAGWPIGFLLAATTAYFVIPAFGWRAMFLIAAVPALLVVPIRIFVREPDAPARAVERPRATLAELAAPGVARMIALASFVMALGFVVYYGLTSQYSYMLQNELGLDAQAAYVHVIVFNVGMLVGVVIAGFVASRWGIVTALVAPALLMVPALPLYVGAVPGLLGVGAFLGGALGVGYSGVTPVLTTSLFPEHVRARAIGIVYHAGALFAAFVPWLIGELASGTLSLATTIAVVSGIGLVAMVVVVLALRRDLERPDDPGKSLARGATRSATESVPMVAQDDQLAAAGTRYVDASVRGELVERRSQLAG
jgi:SHS family lactate transporter-like MFS transporter